MVHCFYYNEISGKGTAVSWESLYKLHNKVKGLDKDVPLKIVNLSHICGRCIWLYKEYTAASYFQWSQSWHINMEQVK